MKTVNFFDAYLQDGSDKSIQFSLIVPTDDPGPRVLPRIVGLILDNKVYFQGGEFDSDYFDREAEEDESV